MTKPITRSLEPNHKLAFSIRETAAAYGVCANTVRKMIKLGELEAVRIGRAVRVTLEMACAKRFSNISATRSTIEQIASHSASQTAHR
jgi:excisionase family DNA binding protein